MYPERHICDEIISRHELLLLRAQPTWMGRTMTRSLPRLTGDGGEYVVTVIVSVE